MLLHVSSWLPFPVQIVNISTRVSVLSKKIMWHPIILKEGYIAEFYSVFKLHI